MVNILKKIRRKIIQIPRCIMINIKVINLLNDKTEKLIMLNTPLHGNLGDQALAYAEELYCERNFPNKKYIEIYGNFLDVVLWLLPYFIKKGDNICIHAGGYLGTLWLNEEKRVRKILCKFGKRSITIFPQTVFFDNNAEGNKELEISKKIYNDCLDLTVCTREAISYGFMKENFEKCKVLLMPDMVMALPRKEFPIKREGCLLCMRGDSERTCSNDEQEKIKSIIKKLFKKVWYTDTVVNHNVKKKDREKELNKKWEEFASAEVVITDRLHGMIFAAITETPCVVISSKSHKVEGCYEWIKDCEYVKMCNGIENINKRIQEVLSIPKCTWDNNKILEKFDLLKTIK